MWMNGPDDPKWHPFIADRTGSGCLDSSHRSRRSTIEKVPRHWPVSLTAYGADGTRTGCPITRLSQVALTLSLYSTKSLDVMFQSSARAPHTWLVAVALSVHVGVYCCRHRVPPGRSLPVGTKKIICCSHFLKREHKERTIYVGIYRLY